MLNLFGEKNSTKAAGASSTALAKNIVSNGADPSKSATVPAPVVPNAVSRDALQALSAGQPTAPAQPVYQGDPDNQVIVFDGDETIWDDFDKHKGDEAKIKELGRTIITVPANDPRNKLNREIRYVIRPGVEELFSYLKARGHKIVICTRNYEDLAETMVAVNPFLNQHVDGVLGRSDLVDNINKDFVKYPKHPDNISIGQKIKNFSYKYLWWYPTYPFRFIASVISGAGVPRLPAMPGQIGKYPPNMIEMLNGEGNGKFQNCKPPRILVDNKVEYEADDPTDASKFKYDPKGIDFLNSSHSDFAVVSPNVVRNPGEKRASHFFAEFNEPKIKVKDPNTGEEKEVYLWVKNVIEAIERGWKGQYKLLHGKDPN